MKKSQSLLYNTTTSDKVSNKPSSSSSYRSRDTSSASENDSSSRYRGLKNTGSSEYSDRTINESVADFPLHGRFNQRLQKGKSFSEASLYRKNINDNFFISKLKEATLYQLYKAFGPNEELIAAMNHYEHHILSMVKTLGKLVLFLTCFIKYILLLTALRKAQDFDDIFFAAAITLLVLCCGLSFLLPDVIKKYLSGNTLTIIRYKDYFYGELISLQILLLISDFLIVLLTDGNRLRAINLLVILLTIIFCSVLSFNFEYIDWALVMYHLTQARVFIYLFLWIAEYHASGLAVFTRFVNKCALYITGGYYEVEKCPFILEMFPQVILIACIIKLKFIFKPLMSVFFYYAGLLECSGPEFGACVINSLLGPIAGLVFVHDFLPLMTNSELHLILTSGFSSYSGELLINTVTSPLIQKHRMLSSMISFPLSIATSKMIHPETKYQLTTYANRKYIRKDKGDNIFAILVKGANAGIEMFVNGGSVVFTLSVLSYFIRLITSNIHDSILCIVRDRAQALFAFFLTPLMYIAGINHHDVLICAYIYCKKVLQSEKEAFHDLHVFMKNPGTREPCVKGGPCVWGTSTPFFEQGFYDPDSKIIVTYLLSGFSAFERFAFYVAAMIVLIPERMNDIAKLIGTTFLAGFCANLFGSLIIGLWLG